MSSAFSIFRPRALRIPKKRVFTRATRKARAAGAKRQRIAHRPEIHYLETYDALAPVGTGSSTLFAINQVAEGTDFNQRNGRVITGTMVQLKMIILPPTTTTGDGSNDMVKWAIVNDKSGLGIAPAYGDIFDAAAIPTVGLDFKNIAKNIDRFTILKAGQELVANGTPDFWKFINVYVKIPPKISRSNYGGTLGNPPLTNALYLVVASFQNTGLATTSARVSWGVRYSFNDV